ncbi:MAG TPA: 1,2-phenylacetyl-CoA epoxidase subunit PaaD [Candidatus Angelobacter sp.]|nr:1,2-phenylacetyl-CoA epoxidase subunit PaaD [Candidatus Angelobacter sp.]
MNNQDLVLKALNKVKDPELPTISIVELGMLNTISITDRNVEISLLPTFSGCPALDLIEAEVKKALTDLDEVDTIIVKFTYDPPWTTDRIQPEAREKLKAFGISPPPSHHKEGDPWVIECPYCGSDVVTMENIFGPTACRSLLYCRACRNPFEAMKPIANLNSEADS